MVSIVGYGAYIPQYRIRIRDIAEIWGMNGDDVVSSLGIEEKSVPGIDEDTSTLAVEAAKNALKRAGISPKKVGAVYVGSESHPYVVKPTSSIVAEGIGAVPELTAADLEFACKAGTAGMQMVMGLVGSGMIQYGMTIGSDSAQGKPGDALEYTTGAGAGAMIIGKEGVADIKATYSYTTDTPDFWRREGADFPSHGGRFTGIPAYFKHTINATKGLLEKTGERLEEFDFVIFHQPNEKYPVEAAKKMKIPLEKLKPGLLVRKIGNTYSGATLVSLAHVLDISKPGNRILLTSFGSGAGSDAFSIEVNDGIEEVKTLAPTTMSYVNRKIYLNYGKYVKHKGKLK